MAGLKAAFSSPRLWLAPLTKGGNAPFRRLCVEDFGAQVTVSEMAYARFLLKGSQAEKARTRPPPLNTTPPEHVFGVQIATNSIDEGIKAFQWLEEAHERRLHFLELNCGCPTYETWHRGLGAALLHRPAKLQRLVEGIASGISRPLTVKMRLGVYSASAASKLAEAVENAGAAAVIIHGRTKEQRYTKAADWESIRQLVEERTVPVVGNGDILTWYEARERLAYSGAAGIMTGRGALIKPWIFKEFNESKAWEPSTEERVGVYLRLVGYMREHFGMDEKGHKRYMGFMPWHLGFFCRYRPLPQELFGGRPLVSPLLQTRWEDTVEGEPPLKELPLVEQLLRCRDHKAHEQIAILLWRAESLKEAMELLTAEAERSLVAWQAAEGLSYQAQDVKSSKWIPFSDRQSKNVLHG